MLLFTSTAIATGREGIVKSTDKFSRPFLARTLCPEEKSVMSRRPVRSNTRSSGLPRRELGPSMSTTDWLGRIAVRNPVPLVSPRPTRSDPRCSGDAPRLVEGNSVGVAVCDGAVGGEGASPDRNPVRPFGRDVRVVPYEEDTGRAERESIRLQNPRDVVLDGEAGHVWGCVADAGACHHQPVE